MRDLPLAPAAPPEEAENLIEDHEQGPGGEQQDYLRRLEGPGEELDPDGGGVLQGEDGEKADEHHGKADRKPYAAGWLPGRLRRRLRFLCAGHARPFLARDDTRRKGLPAVETDHCLNKWLRASFYTGPSTLEGPWRSGF